MQRRRLSFHTKLVPYLVFSVLILPIVILGIAISILRSDDGGMAAPLIVLAMYLFVIGYLASFKVLIEGDILHARNYYIWHRIPLSEIERAYIQTSMKTWLGERMTFRIWIEPRKGSGYKGFFIPIVNYKPEQLRELYEILGIESKRTRLFSREKV